MKIFAVSLLVISVLLAIYALWVREWLKSKPWAKPFFDWIEPIELVLWKKSETILFARLKILTGLILALLTNLGTINLSSLMPIVPDKYKAWVDTAVNLAPLLLSVVGWLDEQLRKKTTMPIELVAVSETKAPIEVKLAIAQADEAKEAAVATVKAA